MEFIFNLIALAMGILDLHTLPRYNKNISKGDIRISYVKSKLC